jgi:hypothetical protein
LLGKRDFHAHSRGVMGLICSDVVGAAGAHMATGRTTSKQQE